MLGQLFPELPTDAEIILTSPPFEPRHYRPVYGAWRVIRTRVLSDGRRELTVARELLREEKNAPLG